MSDELRSVREMANLLQRAWDRLDMSPEEVQAIFCDHPQDQLCSALESYRCNLWRKIDPTPNLSMLRLRPSAFESYGLAASFVRL